jgi:sugar lactone lactonase YvrE
MKRGNWAGRITMFLVAAALVYNSNAQVVTVYAGTGNEDYNGENVAASAANMGKVPGAVTDADGNLIYADAGNNRIRKISADGKVTTIAGCGRTGYTPDGVKATEAAIAQPTGVAIDKEGNIYFSEYLNACVRKINKDGTLSTVAGTATAGYFGNTGLATKAQLQGPLGIAFDKAGNLYIADADNNCVRKVDKTGIITLYAGNAKGHGTGLGGYSGDGGKATAAQLNQPGSLAFDDNGNLYIADCFNHCIRKVTASGIIYTIAGTGQAGFSGDGDMAKKAMLNFPDGLAVSNDGNVYVSDHGNNRIRIITPSGYINTVVGDGSISKRFGKPSFVILNSNNGLLIGDNSNYCIRSLANQHSTVVHSGGSAASGNATASGVSGGGGQ